MAPEELALSLTISRAGNVLLLLVAIAAAAIAYRLWATYNAFLSGDTDVTEAAEAAAEVSRLCKEINAYNRVLSLANANSGRFQAIHVDSLGDGEEIDLGLLSPEEAVTIAQRRLDEAHENLREAMRRLRKV